VVWEGGAVRLLPIPIESHDAAALDVAVIVVTITYARDL
jgi:hypothetical protein